MGAESVDLEALKRPGAQGEFSCYWERTLDGGRCGDCAPCRVQDQFPAVLAALERIPELERGLAEAVARSDEAVLREIALHEQIPTDEERARLERVEKAARAMRRWQGEMWRMGVLAQQDIDALIAALAPAPADEVAHMAPSVNKAVMPCCGRTPFELRATDRMTLDQARVTCRGTAPDGEASGGR